MRRAAMLLVLLTAAPAWGQSVRLPGEVKVPVGRLAAVTVEYDGDAIKWDVPEGLDCFREYDPDPKTVKLRMVGYAPGRYRLLAVAAKGGKLSDFGVCVVTVGDGPGPLPPGPGPQPPDPPDDPLYGRLQTAYAADTTPGKAADVKLLAALYRQAEGVAVSPDVATWGDLLGVLRRAAVAQLGERLPAVRQALAAEFRTVLPVDPAAPLDGPGRAKAAAQFKRVAALLEAVK